MHFSAINVTSLKTYEDCDRAISKIESDHRNFLGGASAFNSGYQCYLKKGAEKKIEAIERRQQKLLDKGIKEEYQRYLKRNPGTSLTLEEFDEQGLYC